MPTRTISIPAILALLIGCDGGPLAGPADTASPDASFTTDMAAAGEAVLPWRISATVATTPANPPSGCLVYFTSVIEGRATHLGEFTGTGSTCVTGVIQPDPDPPFLPAGPPPYFTGHFTNPLWTLTSSNGDELWLESVEAVAVISLTDNSLRAVGRQRILGGTGRFAGATGEAMVGAVNDDGQGPDDFEGTGWIRYRAADRGGR